MRRGGPVVPYADVGGCALYYETMGSGPPVVFIHGHTLDRRLWDDQVGVVSRDFTVTMPAQSR